VLLFIDNIFRFTQAGSEVSTLLGRMPSAVGYQPTLADEMGELQERITSTRGRSITSMQAIYVPADDYTDPAPATTFAHLDATTELSRDLQKGIYPAVDPLASTSRILDPRVVGEEHYESPAEVQEILQKYKELQDIIAILGMDELSEEDKLTVGVLSYRAPGKEWRTAAVSEGMVKVEGNDVLVLVDSAEYPEEIDAKRAQRAADEAKEAILQKRSVREYRTAQANLARAINRLRVKKNAR
jgi:hypothetical protein